MPNPSEYDTQCGHHKWVCQQGENGQYGWDDQFTGTGCETGTTTTEGCGQGQWKVCQNCVWSTCQTIDDPDNACTNLEKPIIPVIGLGNCKNYRVECKQVNGVYQWSPTNETEWAQPGYECISGEYQQCDRGGKKSSSSGGQERFTIGNLIRLSQSYTKGIKRGGFTKSDEPDGDVVITDYPCGTDHCSCTQQEIYVRTTCLQFLNNEARMIECLDRVCGGYCADCNTDFGAGGDEPGTGTGNTEYPCSMNHCPCSVQASFADTVCAYTNNAQGFAQCVQQFCGRGYCGLCATPIPDGSGTEIEDPNNPIGFKKCENCRWVSYCR